MGPTTNFTGLAESQARAVAKISAALSSKRRHHAYLVVGAEPGSRRALAETAAKGLLCQSTNSQACGECSSCQKLQAGHHPDFLRIAPDDKQTIGIAAIRDLKARLALRASESPLKVTVIDSADSMTAAAQNALLKTLEEPPGPTCFFVLANSRRNLLPTIRSRTQLLRLAPTRGHAAKGVLQQAGIDTSIAGPLAALLGAQPEQAQAMLEADALAILEKITRAAAGTLPMNELLSAAADLGGGRQRYELTLALLEVYVRDALAEHSGVHLDLLYGAPAKVPDKQKLLQAAERLTEARRTAALNPNRTMMLESIFLALAASL